MSLTSIALNPARPHSKHGQHLGYIDRALAAESLQTVVLIMGDDRLRENHEAHLRGLYRLAVFATREAYLKSNHLSDLACLVVQSSTADLSGLRLLEQLQDEDSPAELIMIGLELDVSAAVTAMKAGAFDVLENPVAREVLRASVAAAWDQINDTLDCLDCGATRSVAVARSAILTPRQHQVLNLILAGNPSKYIAADLGISQRTVENHRAAIMKRTGSRSIPALVQKALGADRTSFDMLGRRSPLKGSYALQ